jgi:hypothetical protein
MALVTVFIVPLPFGVPVENPGGSAFAEKDKFRGAENKRARTGSSSRIRGRNRRDYDSGTAGSET